MKLSIIVPCYNEVENITKLHGELLPVVEELAATGWNGAADKNHHVEVLFVDDGSRDGTHDRLVEQFGGSQPAGVTFRFCKHEVNQGLGAAIRTGFSHADGNILVTVDCDGTYKFAEIPAMLTCLAPDVDIVTASPYHPEGHVVGVPADRLVLSRGSSFLYRVLVDPRIYTYTALFRAYRAEVIRSITFESNGFLAGTELLVKAILSGYRVAEFPAVLHRRTYGVSKAKIAQTIRSHLRFQGRIFVYRTQQFVRRKPNEVAL